MFITNPRSDLTPTQDLKLGCIKSKFGMLPAEKERKRKLDAQRGLNEHSCLVPSSMPYVSVRNIF